MKDTDYKIKEKKRKKRQACKHFKIPINIVMRPFPNGTLSIKKDLSKLKHLF